VTNPAPDQISVTFDPCYSFAQQHVQYVLSNKASFLSPCVQRIASVELPEATLTAYRVTAPGGAQRG
jgi:hypothetical protein